MTHLSISKGLDIPIQGKPAGAIQPLITNGGTTMTTPEYLALNLTAFEDVKFKLLAKVGDHVTIGQPLAEDKSCPGRFFCSPAAGTIHEIGRGPRRVLTHISIKAERNESFFEHPTTAAHASREELIDRLKAGGMFAHIRSRPFNLLADPQKAPRNIFVKAIESAPFTPSAEMQVEGYEEEFAAGLQALSKLTTGKVHLVYRKDSTLKAFTNAQHVEKHTAEGPHPIATHSVHIQLIDPIQSVDDCVWTLSALEVVMIGHLLKTGRYFVDRIVSVAGPGVLPGRTGYFQARMGMPISSFISGRIDAHRSLRLISGDPLMGKKVSKEDFLGFYDTVVCVIPEETRRELLHFFRLGKNKFTASRAYLSGIFRAKPKEYAFTTSQHGEHRAFVDATLYDRVMPLPISTMMLVKAIMAEDYELAETLGLLSVDSEDFALPTFVCPSKMEMTEIVRQGIKQYAHDVLS